MVKKRALIIGGSLAGLFTAQLLRSIGWEVEVFERVPDEMSSRGAGIVTHPELFEALARCGIAKDCDLGVEVTTRIVLERDGRVSDSYALQQVTTSWGRLFGLLKGAFPALSYHADRTLQSVEQDDRGVTAVFADGARANGDLLVAADGIRSTVRGQYLPNVKPQYAGYVGWRGLVEEKDLSPATHAALFDKFAFCLPAGEQMLGYPVPGAQHKTAPGRRRYNFVWYRPIEESGALRDLLTDAQGLTHEIAIPPPLIRRDLVQVMRRDADALLAPQFAEIVRLTGQPFFQPIYDVESPRLVFGKVVVLGDAAFTARPHVGMGVTKAAEDAMALADLLAQTGGDSAERLSAFEADRLAFGASIIARARHLGAYMQAQAKTALEREMAERYRSPANVIRENAIPPPFVSG